MPLIPTGVRCAVAISGPGADPPQRVPGPGQAARL